MDAKLYRGVYLSSFVDAVLDNLSKILEDDDSVLVVNYAAKELLERLEECLLDVAPVLDDAELKQFTDKRVKKWHVDLQDALYFADDLLDELSTKTATATATQRDPAGISSYCISVVDSILEDSREMEDIVRKLEKAVARKSHLPLEKTAKVDVSWRIPFTSLVVSSDIFDRDKDKEEIIKLLLADTCKSCILPASAVHIGVPSPHPTALYPTFDNLEFSVSHINFGRFITISENLELFKINIPRDTGTQMLTEIEVYKCKSVTLLPLGTFPNLKKLKISDCPEVDCFGEECLPPSLTTLKIRKCQKLERWITSNGGLPSFFPSVSTIIGCLPPYQNGECPLTSKLQEMNDPRIQIQTDLDLDYWFHRS
ncbi:hypothetical protein PIB30_064196 [Stylosanthes scabra]|uniref:Disease resistance N-terminal domain-containing protein n=1 Tax=Stylosanthes scabra TaxID=79078 RepID=A0ABU6UPN2_9FABA|nr:hypothetical protein [Stylosanthes scabra]